MATDNTLSLFTAILGLKDVLYTNEPDLTYYCSQCARFIALLSLMDHKAYHSAIALLELSHPPSSIKSLVNRRYQIVNRLKVIYVCIALILDFGAKFIGHQIYGRN